MPHRDLQGDAIDFCRFPSVSYFVSSCLRARHSGSGLVLKGWVHTKAQSHEGLKKARTAEEGHASSCPGPPTTFQRQQIRQFIALVFPCGNVPSLNRILVASQIDPGTTTRAPPNSQEDQSSSEQLRQFPIQFIRRFREGRRFPHRSTRNQSA